MKYLDQKALVQKASDIAGGQTALAKELTRLTGEEITQQRVNNWIVRGDSVPTEFMAPIEIVTNNKVTRKQFCPKNWQIIWPELAEKRLSS